LEKLVTAVRDRKKIPLIARDEERVTKVAKERILFEHNSSFFRKPNY
jgi:hypothetical protein